MGYGQTIPGMEQFFNGGEVADPPVRRYGMQPEDFESFQQQRGMIEGGRYRGFGLPPNFEDLNPAQQRYVISQIERNARLYEDHANDPEKLAATGRVFPRENMLSSPYYQTTNALSRQGAETLYEMGLGDVVEKYAGGTVEELMAELSKMNLNPTQQSKLFPMMTAGGFNRRELLPTYITQGYTEKGQMLKGTDGKGAVTDPYRADLDLIEGAKDIELERIERMKRFKEDDFFNNSELFPELNTPQEQTPEYKGGGEIPMGGMIMGAMEYIEKFRKPKQAEQKPAMAGGADRINELAMSLPKEKKKALIETLMAMMEQDEE